MENLKEDDTILERFNSKFQKEKCLNKESLKYYSNKIFDEYCWIWTAYKDRDGYGTIGVGPTGNKIVRPAHRVSYELFIDVIPENKLVCHYCDTPSCVNPNHLFLGDFQINNNDRNQKKRSAYGKRNGMYTKPETRSYNNQYNAKSWIITDENNIQIKIFNLKQFCREHNIEYDLLLHSSRAENFYKGFKVEKVKI